MLINQTFRGDHRDIQTNACVGNNGWVDAITYADGFDLAVRNLCEKVLANQAPADAAIYPVAFCARHRIELGLKAQILSLRRVSRAAKQGDVDITRLHDLKVLWTSFTELAYGFDRRYAAGIEAIDPIVLDFAQIDPTGQTFRYPHDRAGGKHLVETRLVNIRHLFMAYDRIDETLKGFDFLTIGLCEEYALGTRTRSLSRRDIMEISEALPPRSEWGEDVFDEVRNSLCESYGVGRRELSEALQIIQGHAEFGANIGIERPLLRVVRAELSILLSMKSTLEAWARKRHLPVAEQISIQLGGGRLPSPSKEELDCEKRLVEWLSSLSNEAVAELAAIAGVSHWQFCERYEEHYALVFADFPGERAREQQRIVKSSVFLAQLARGLSCLGIPLA